MVFYLLSQGINGLVLIHVTVNSNSKYQRGQTQENVNAGSCPLTSPRCQTRVPGGRHVAVRCGPMWGGCHTGHSSWQAPSLSPLCRCLGLCQPGRLPQLPAAQTQGAGVGACLLQQVGGCPRSSYKLACSCCHMLVLLLLEKVQNVFGAVRQIRKQLLASSVTV
jgi:hypothetical protein